MFCKVLMVLSVVGVLICLSILCSRLFLMWEYEQLEKLNRIGYDFDKYVELKRAIVKIYSISNFKVVYFKDDFIVLKIGKRYFSIDNDTFSLHFLFEENECLLEKIENIKNL